jgi:hypothetical protein
MKVNFHVPLDSIVRSVAWLNSPFAFIRTGDNTFRNVCDVINSEFVHMSIKDIERFWGSIIPFWTLPEYERLGLKCFPLKDSVSIAKEFLQFQFNGDEESVVNFLQVCASVLNRETQKKNCIEILSPPSAGKNWFIDPILVFMCCHGQIMNAKKGSQFPLDNCFNKRVLYFNEPNFENSFQETLLMLFAGDPISEQAKYKSVAQIVRTPVIVTCNSSPFGRDLKWSDRMYRFTWKRAPFLKELRNKLSPLTFVSLLKEYKIDYN